MIKHAILSNSIVSFIILISISCCSRGTVEQAKTNPVNPPTPITNEVDVWLTKSDQSIMLQKQSSVLAFTSPANNYQNIDIDTSQNFQSVDGFGYTLTGGSAEVINRLTSVKKQELLQDLFGNSASSIAVSYLRISIGASDLNSSVFSYDDLGAGDTDVNLTKFSLDKDQQLISLLKEILAINPKIKILATPWSSPVWMKDNKNTVGGSLLPQYYSVYAQYFVKYIQAMQQNGILIDAVTPQNEPLNPHNNPSLVMTALQQANFIKNNLGPAFKNVGISTKIISYDHNCDEPNYPISVLSDATANPFIDGSAFHLYAGDISALSTVHNAFPSKNIYFTEQYTASTADFGGDLKWHVKNVIIGSLRNWSKNALEWNLANDASFSPHTSGGCAVCKGAITITSSESYTKNVAYYIIAHASKFVPQNSVRIASSQGGTLNNVAFKTPEGKLVLIVENDGANIEAFNIKINGKWANTILDAGAVATYVF